uniref:Glycosyltransferase n=1 Tax=Vitis vinifera TaxID=29760 RepID=C7G3B5_VITVI|nr:UDP-sugar flavonoid glycosyltransferase [Vitis vinifera]
MTTTASSMDRHVAVLGFPTHTATLLKLLRGLASAAPTTIFSFFNTPKANSSISSAQSPHGIHNLRVYDVADGVPEDLVLSANPLARIEMFLKATPGNFRDALEVAEKDIGRKISCLVSDVFLWFTADMAEEMGVPWVAIRTAALYSLSVHIYTDAIREAVGVAGQVQDQTLDFIPGFSAIKVEDLPEGMVFGDTESPFACMLHKMGLMLPRATIVATNSFEELEPTIVTNDLKSKLQKVLTVGPFDLSSPPPLILDASGCLPWLDNKKEASVAYVSFGSIATPPPNEIVALAEALEATGIPFLWSLREHAMNNLPKGFLERTTAHGKVVSWAPQPQVLAHASVAVFITHSGWNSVTESIVGGVPMICRPFFGDQRLNRRMVQDVWGIGIGVEGGILTKRGVMSALGLILSHEGKKMREKIGVLKELARRAVEPNGSSTQNLGHLLEVITTSKLPLDTNK